MVDNKPCIFVRFVIIWNKSNALKVYEFVIKMLNAIEFIYIRESICSLCHFPFWEKKNSRKVQRQIASYWNFQRMQITKSIIRTPRTHTHAHTHKPPKKESVKNKNKRPKLQTNAQRSASLRLWVHVI